MPTNVPVDNIAIFTVSALDDTGTSRAATGTISIDDYATAYVAKNAGGQVVLVTRTGIPSAGQAKAVNVAVDGNDAQGNPIPQLIIPFTLQGPPAPPNATHFAQSGMAVRDKIGYPVPVDPGSAGIPL